MPRIWSRLPAHQHAVRVSEEAAASRRRAAEQSYERAALYSINRIPQKIMQLYFSYAFARMYAQSWSISASESTSFQGGIWFLPSRTAVPNFARSLAVNRRRFGN